MSKGKNIKTEDLIGKEYHHWKIVEYSHRDKHGLRIFLCQCQCGAKKHIRCIHLFSGLSKSCGCLPRKPNDVKHGLTYSPEWIAWKEMKRRCLNKTHKAYSYYGGRGIKICKAWIDSFKNFISDMGFKPSLQHSIDRINNDGDYEPENCRWATAKEQANNRRPRNSALTDLKRRMG